LLWNWPPMCAFFSTELLIRTVLVHCRIL
jgi:hypothetical protein